MRIGDLTDRVQIETDTQSHSSADSFGRTDTFAPPLPAVVWADVRQLRGEKRYMDVSAQYVVAYRVTIRYNPDIKLNSRLKWGTRYLYVNDIEGDMRDGIMRLMCYEKTVG